MSRRRWWDSGSRSIEAEKQWFADEGLDFVLDEQLLKDKEVVAFRGDLRLGPERCAASVVYPPSYGVGGHPIVVALGLPVERHISPEGVLCLDHPVFGETAPMYGAEAAARAQHLWDLWVNDRQRLWEEEADTPDPKANYYEYCDDTAVVLVDVDVTGATQGYFRAAATQFSPFRAGIVQVRTERPTVTVLDAGPTIASFAGPLEVNGQWLRVPEPPPRTLAELNAWLQAQHGEFVNRHITFTKAQAAWTKVADLPAVVAFVYPDEGPSRGQVHDAWLFCVIDPHTGRIDIPRAFHLRSDERWLRQPQMQPLEEKTVAVVGVGALGSQVADQLAKAGVKGLFLIDYDFMSTGNRVRHQLDLTDLGRSKVQAVAARMLRVHPWCEVAVQTARVGSAGWGRGEGASQELDDRLLDEFRECDLIINASAHSATGSHLSSLGHEADRPVIHGWVSAGAWGARVLRQRKDQTGCWDCLALSQRPGETVEVPPVSEDPYGGEVTERGCADPSFTGPGFELAAAASAMTRLAVQTLLADPVHYPDADYDLVTWSFRTETTAEPTATYTDLPVHPDCPICTGL